MCDTQEKTTPKSLLHTADGLKKEHLTAPAENSTKAEKNLSDSKKKGFEVTELQSQDLIQQDAGIQTSKQASSIYLHYGTFAQKCKRESDTSTSKSIS